MKSEWIRFNDERPPYDKRIFLCAKFIKTGEHLISVAVFNKCDFIDDWFVAEYKSLIISPLNNGYFILEDYPRKGRVMVYWMALPEPPKVGD